MNPGGPGGYWYGYGYQQPQVLFHVKNVCISQHYLKQVPLRKGWTKKVPGPSQFGTFHAYYSPTTGLSGGGKWGAEVINSWQMNFYVSPMVTKMQFSVFYRLFVTKSTPTPSVRCKSCARRWRWLPSTRRSLELPATQYRWLFHLYWESDCLHWGKRLP